MPVGLRYRDSIWDWGCATFFAEKEQDSLVNDLREQNLQANGLFRLLFTVLLLGTVLITVMAHFIFPTTHAGWTVLCVLSLSLAAAGMRPRLSAPLERAALLVPTGPARAVAFITTLPLLGRYAFVERHASGGWLAGIFANTHTLVALVVWVSLYAVRTMDATERQVERLEMAKYKFKAV